MIFPMRFLSTIFFIFLINYDLVQCQLTPKEIQYVLDDHNTARRTLANPVANNMIMMQWDPLLAQVAQTYANSCTSASFQHNAARTTQYQALGGGANAQEPGGLVYVGENWYSGSPTNLTDTLLGGATKAWTTGGCLRWSISNIGVSTCTQPVCSEMQDFYQTGTVAGTACSQQTGEIGHFTQVMWAATAFVGCGYSAQCGTVCDYGPGGNFNLPTGTEVASSIWGVGGSAASQCPTSTPNNNLGLCSTTSAGSGSGSDSGSGSGSTSIGALNFFTLFSVTLAVLFMVIGKSTSL